MFESRQPSAPLSSYVEMLWYYDGYRTARHRERVLPNGQFQLIVDLSVGPGAVAGPHSRYLELDTTPIQTVMGVVFRPGGARPFIDYSAEDFANKVVPLDLLWMRLARDLLDHLQKQPTISRKFTVCERMLLGILRGRPERRRDPHPAIRYALDEFQRAPSVRKIREITKDAGLSPRRFSHLFREQVGFTPKVYCRVRRFHDVVRRIAAGVPVDWADVAVAGGYYDQAHLSHEFRTFSGLSPTAYLAAARPFDDHVAT